MENIKQTSGQYFKSLLIVYYGLLVGQIVFGLLSLFLVSTDKMQSDGEQLSKIFIYIVPFFVLSGLIVSNIIFKNRLKAIDRESSLLIKLNDYRGALVVRYALLEGSSLFALIVYLVTSDITFLIFAVFIIVYFLTIRPNKENAIRDINLKLDDEQILLDPDREINAY